MASSIALPPMMKPNPYLRAGSDAQYGQFSRRNLYSTEWNQYLTAMAYFSANIC